MAIRNIDEVLTYCYRKLFANSVPRVDFDKLVQTALPNQYGRKVIDCSLYQIDEDKYNKVIEETIKRFNIRQKKYQEGLRYSIRFGSSPTIKRK
jgi:hypothetical protein